MIRTLLSISPLTFMLQVCEAQTLVTDLLRD